MGDSDRRIFGGNVRRFREALGMTQEDVSEASGLDRSYIGGVERGERNPALTAILKLASALRVSPERLFEGFTSHGETHEHTDRMTAQPVRNGLAVRFRYDQHDAEYLLSGATIIEFNQVLSVLRDGLASGITKTDVVADTFRRAMNLWPNANPSDVWTFIVNRAYCDRSNHPEANARLNLEQSWERTSGWALERILVSHYQDFLLQNGLTAKVAQKSEKIALLGSLNDPRVVPDKADILITFNSGAGEQLLGVVHVKASLAERRTDDVPMSQALIEQGYISVFWTMDVKSFPGEKPDNQGEFGEARVEEINDKRRDFEEHGHFSACFSYNLNTGPTLPREGLATRIFVCDFTNPDDSFSQFLVEALQHRLESQHQFGAA